MNSSARYAIVGICLFLFAGCAMLDPGPPVPSVLLLAEMPRPVENGKLPVRIMVARPAVDSATDTDRIMALMNGFEIRAFDSARWVSPVPLIVQRQLVDALEFSGRFAAVGGEDSTINEKYRLTTDIRRFFLRYDDSRTAPTVDSMMVFALVRTETGAIIARKIVRVEEPCAANTLEAFVTAFGRAMTQTLAETVTWTGTVLEAQLAATP